jgi:hypothetical protein
VASTDISWNQGERPGFGLGWSWAQRRCWVLSYNGRGFELRGGVLAALAACFVGGWIFYASIVKANHDPRMYLMIVLSAIELAALAFYWLRRRKPAASSPLDNS